MTGLKLTAEILSSEVMGKSKLNWPLPLANEIYTYAAQCIHIISTVCFQHPSTGLTKAAAEVEKC